MKWPRRDIRTNTLLAAPAVALALAACAGGASEVSSDEASPPAAVTAEAETSAPVEATESGSESATSDGAPSESTTSEAADAAEPAQTGTESAAAAPLIQRLSADEAIANAEVNLPNLQSADSVLDIETLAVSDGSVQTLRNVVAGDKPVLLWFFSPH